MKTVAFAIQKGGVGKTSVSGNVARIVSGGHRTLLVDADPQGSLTSWLLTETPGFELADVLQGRTTLGEAIVELGPTLGLVPTFGIGGGLGLYGETQLQKEPFIFDDLAAEAALKGYEAVIYDTHPGAGWLERAVVMGCQEVISPITLEYLSLDGIEIFKGFLAELSKGFHRTVRHDRLVLNMVNKSFRRHGIYHEKIGGLGYEIFEVGQDSRIAEAQMAHRFLIDYEPTARALPELERLASALMEE